MANSTLIRSRITALLTEIEGAYAPNTLRAFRADFEEFIYFCEDLGAKALPASPETVARFIERVTQKKLASASIRRKVVSIGSVHRLLELADPTKAGCVKLATRKMHRRLGRASRQAHPVNKDTLAKMLAACTANGSKDALKTLRDRALLMVAYDTMARRSELVALRFEDIGRSQEAAGIYLHKSKVDQEGRGRWLPISEKTVKAIRRWQAALSADSGYILRGVSRGRVNEHLSAGQVGRIFKRLAQRAGLPSAVTQHIGGHSIRVGAAQDWTSKGISLPQLMILGGWEKPDTAIRYVGQSRLKLEGLQL